MTSIRLVIVDDDPLVRAGLRVMLDGADGIVVVAEAADGGEVPRVLDANPADVVLMDLRMPRVDGITATRRARDRADAPQVIVLTTFDSDDNVVSALRAGAVGFLLKDTPPGDIVAALRRVVAGDPAVSSPVLRRLLDRTVARDELRDTARAALAKLSAREHDVVVALEQGYTNADIARRLGVSVATVKTHLTSVLTKLGVDNRTQVALLVHDAHLP
ncbi:response regulator transcription factor [Saccharomonospora piscinae]|uniref:response regulator transcription factor n=1 Tax=Saccharomonospora piscinae TaxID=687388 RepID=UPI0031345947